MWSQVERALDSLMAGLSGSLAVWVGLASLATFVLGLVLAPVVFVRMPADYFVRASASRGTEGREGRWGSGRTLLRLLVLALKNVLGALLLVAGIAMLLLPGQGLLTILAALTLLRFPGKRRLQLRLLRAAPVRRVVDGLRRRANRPPLVLEFPHGRNPAA